MLRLILPSLQQVGTSMETTKKKIKLGTSKFNQTQQISWQKTNFFVEINSTDMR